MTRQLGFFCASEYLSRLIIYLAISAATISFHAGTANAKPKISENHRPLFPARFDMENYCYRVENLPPSHGYKIADRMTLYAGTDTRRGAIVGFGVLTEVTDTQATLSPESIRHEFLGRDLLSGPVIDATRIGKFRGSVVSVRPSGYLVNIGSGVGVETGDCYKVLGDPITDVVPGMPALGYEEIGTMEVIQSNATHARLRLLDGIATKKLFVQYMTSCLSLNIRKLLTETQLEKEHSIRERTGFQYTPLVLEFSPSTEHKNENRNLLSQSSPRIERKNWFSRNKRPLAVGFSLAGAIAIGIGLGYYIESIPPTIGPIIITP